MPHLIISPLPLGVLCMVRCRDADEAAALAERVARGLESAEHLAEVAGAQRVHECLRFGGNV